MIITEKKLHKNNIQAVPGLKAVLVQCTHVRPLELGSALQTLATEIPMARKERGIWAKGVKDRNVFSRAVATVCS